jgi:hypothetical protein
MLMTKASSDLGARSFEHSVECGLGFAFAIKEQRIFRSRPHR